MKKIGYIYAYSQEEGKGILVFDKWKEETRWRTQTKNTPVLFTSADLLTNVDSGQLVYFDYEGRNVSHIERASLSNFNVDIINELIKCKPNESESLFYYNNTIISFERLDNIYVPKSDEPPTPTKRARRSLLTDDELFLDEFFDEFCLDNSYAAPKTVEEDFNSNVNLPKSILELYNCFGKYEHKGYGNGESRTIDILDLSLWINDDTLSYNYYGRTIEEIKCLYELFVMRKRYDKTGNEIKIKLTNDCISPIWSSLLSKFNHEELGKILKIAPKLQPALPKEFCKKNVGLLTDEYGMPDIEICKLYCLHKISKAVTVSEYKYIKNKLFIYSNCNAEHLEGEGTPMCQMGKRRINNLEKSLDLQYESVIKQNVIFQLSDLSENVDAINKIQKATPDEFNKVGLFIENYYALKNNFLRYKVCEKVFESYEKLPQVYKDALKIPLHNCVNEAAISATKAESLSPFLFGSRLEQLDGWILESTIQQVKSLVNERFSNLDDLEELNNAYKYKFITSEQYCKRYKQLTGDFNTYQFLKELCNYKIDESPLTIQWYVTSNIIKQLAYKSLNSYNYVKVDYCDAISNIRSLLKWLDNYGHLKNIILKKAEERICSVLSDDERWTLFEEKIAKSPGQANIRKRLDIAYKKKFINKELIKHECFQDAMLSDVDKVKAPEVLLFIADNLDFRHLYMMQKKATGFLKLYLWQKHPSGRLEWNLVKSHFHEMSVDAQIRTLRYIFGQMASGESGLDINDLYSELVETSSSACPAICGVLFILNAKKNNINIRITPAMVEKVIGEDLKQRFLFLKDSKELFYPCNGYLAITHNQQNIEYQSFNGILKKEIKDDTLFYVITFHNTPVNLFGRTIEWLDSKEVETAIKVLKRNCDVEIVNGKYYISESQEFFVKQFVIRYDIDDKCGLVSDKERMIELGYLPRNNAFQPLYTNYLRKYEDSEHYICRCGCKGGSDPNNSFPFFWCKKKICARRAHFFLPSSEWEKFRFADLLYIVLGQNSNIRESVWQVNAEISQFICDYAHVYKSSERNICSTPLKESDEKGVWTKDSSTYRDIYDDDDDEYDDEDYSPDYDKPTYNRYNGSYAQDEMGYSDDDIDTIFDGNPDAYWNID